MRALSVQHNEEEIHYDENTDKWRCSNLNLEGATLKAVKDKINKMLAEMRRVNNVKCLEVGGFSDKCLPFIASLIDGDKATEVWGMGVRWNVKDKLERKKVKLEDLILDTAENKAAMKAIDQVRKDAENLNKEAAKMLKAIPRVTRDMLMVEAAEKDL